MYCMPKADKLCDWTSLRIKSTLYSTVHFVMIFKLVYLDLEGNDGRHVTTYV